MTVKSVLWQLRWSKMVWRLRQLLPLQYHSVYYKHGDDPTLGNWHYTVWRMWMGRSFAIRDRVLPR